MLSRIRRIFTGYMELKHLAYHDSLTGLKNRNWLYKNINKIKLKYVYFIDINDLHKINKLGHTCGDEYIKMVVKSINCEGVLVRYAGDEFILFSNIENVIKTNNLYSVGSSDVGFNLLDSINIADRKMIKSKLMYKKNRYEPSRR
jgi:GGDEF domain-containing protein